MLVKYNVCVCKVYTSLARSLTNRIVFTRFWNRGRGRLRKMVPDQHKQSFWIEQ